MSSICAENACSVLASSELETISVIWFVNAGCFTLKSVSGVRAVNASCFFSSLHTVPLPYERPAGIFRLYEALVVLTNPSLSLKRDEAKREVAGESSFPRSGAGPGRGPVSAPGRLGSGAVLKSSPVLGHLPKYGRPPGRRRFPPGPLPRCLHGIRRQRGRGQKRLGAARERKPGGAKGTTERRSRPEERRDAREGGGGAKSAGTGGPGARERSGALAAGPGSGPF